CLDWSFSGSKTSTDLAVMSLDTFALRPDLRDRTVLNVSLTNIGFTNFRYRIQSIGQKNFTFCTEIKLPTYVNISNLHFDCYWIGTKNVGMPYELNYLAEKGALREARSFLFRINGKKVNENMEEWFPFLYVDKTELPVITARWHQTPISLEIRPNYVVRIIDKDIELASQQVDGTHWNSSNDELSYNYTFGMFPKHGHYKVELKVLCNLKNCKTVESPCIII
ncbi:hypothetical protein L9F63_027513, partial [Diploptera punctata]